MEKITPSSHTYPVAVGVSPTATFPFYLVLSRRIAGLCCLSSSGRRSVYDLDIVPLRVRIERIWHSERP